MKMRRSLLGAIFVLGIASLGVSAFAQVCQPEYTAIPEDGAEALGEQRMPKPQYLSDLPWKLATSGWVEVGNNSNPKLDTTFREEPISLGGRLYSKGIGTFPFSEIIYELDGRSTYLRATVGIEDGVPGPQGTVRFLVFVDETLVAGTEVLWNGGPHPRLQAPVAGAKTLRLVVTDAEDGTEGDFAMWADARLVTTGTGEWERARRSLSEMVRRTRDERQARAKAESRRARERAQENLQGLAANFPFDWEVAQEQGAVFDAAGERLIITNGRIAAFLGYGGEQNGVLKVFRLPSGYDFLSGVSPKVVMSDGSALDLDQDTLPMGEDGFHTRRVKDPALGDSLELEARYLLKDMEAEEEITVRIRMAETFPAMIAEVELPEGLAQAVPRTMYYMGHEGAALTVSNRTRYLTDYSQIREGSVEDDGLLRADVVGLGKPLVIWSSESGQGILLALLDEVELPGRLLLKRDPGSSTVEIGFEQPLVERPINRLPRLYIEALNTQAFQDTFRNYRRIMERLYPPLPVPNWVRYQWLSWYVYDTDITEEEIKRQIDDIASRWQDMGPWNVLVDAGWYITEGREAAEWRAVDPEKFPSGMRALVEYAHQRGVRVVLYFSSPFLDDNAEANNWLGLRGIVDDHPEWLIPLPPLGDVRRYVYNYRRPELREYMAEVMRDFFERYGVDGMKLDGLGGGEGQVINRLLFGSVDRNQELLGQTMEIYRFNYQTIANLGLSDFFIESGWVTPIFANRYAHIFRYGDEAPLFSHPYTHPGLREHVDYGLYQHLIGQRGNIGALYMDPNEDQLALSWLEASLALGMQATLSFDLPSVSPETLSALRERLAQLTAFRGGVTQLGPGWLPESFATTVDGTTFLGVINRGEDTKDYHLRLEEYGLNREDINLVYGVNSKRYFLAQDHMDLRLPGNSFRLFVLRSKPGVMWTNSSFELRQEQQGLTVKVNGPTSIDGFLSLYVPRPSEVRLDGRLLEPGQGLGQFEYENRTQLLLIEYPHDTPHTIEVRYGS